MQEGKSSNAQGCGIPDEQTLLLHMQKTMRLNIKAQCYTDAIFYADKIVNLLKARSEALSFPQPTKAGASVSDKTSNQAAAPPGIAGNTSSDADQSSGKLLQNGKSGVDYAANLSEAAASATYDLAYCYLLNGENLRCVELLENSELVYVNLKFRTLVGQALLKAGNI